MSKQDTCIFYEYFGDYGMSLCNHPSKERDNIIYSDSCRKCKLHTTEKGNVDKCPFCGRKPYLSRHCGEWHVGCDSCKVEMKDKDAIRLMKRWNKRGLEHVPAIETLWRSCFLSDDEFDQGMYYTINFKICFEI